ncbi:enoyl-CoA hydratase/isomerase family protein [Phytoactinopolyspora alkaliphila]|uniref:Enoyl-CoA hydratase/isomerase family protein n=1 Tax=Phytoactinopolyspora alkaliphila TaxID=1783498 RepID=A0A6N9YM64_9ACTN|nr:enoyl-CoA hydratase/isomerase family protein [Phytoactinopolyspora alkaliphila]NED96045.1 enoyl-CoA hydratase/isomerase family protein [Phytoactinopolyspora alkaliphila]
MTTSLTTIKVEKGVRDQLAEVARSRHTSMRALLAEFAEQAARDQRWAEIDAAYTRLQDDPEQWADYLAELDSWDKGTGEADELAAEEWPEYQQ